MSARKKADLLRGSVTARVTGKDTEGFLNRCAEKGVPFWDVERPEGHALCLRGRWRDRRRFRELAAESGCEWEELRQSGLPPFLLRFRRRYGLLAGLFLCLLAVSFLSKFILVVEVEGNERVPTAVILTELRRQGLKPGAYGPSFEEREVANRALLELPDVAWMAVNLHGIRAQVVVRERVREPAEEDAAPGGDIVAKAPGIVTHIENWSGDKAVAQGATVLPGDVLIRGSLELPLAPYSQKPVRTVPVRAKGLVEGRTWRTLSASVPLTGTVKTATGDEKTLWSLTFLGQRVNFFQKGRIPFDRYDKIAKTWNLTLPGGKVLPIALRRETLRSYELTDADLDRDAAQAMLEETLLLRLEALLGENGVEVSHHFSALEEDGVLTVTLTAECEEELGRFIPAP